MAGTPRRPTTSNLRDVVAAQAAARPAAPALLAPGRDPLSYRDLLTQIDHGARTLRRLGIGAGDRVALVLPDGPEAVSAFLAVVAVATAAPLNPASRGAEIEARLRALKPRALVLADGGHEAAAVARALGVAVLEIRPAGQQAGALSLEGTAGASARRRRVTDAQVALVLPTSGTTSSPKLVPLTHRNLVAGARNVGAALRLSPDDRCLNVMPLFHVHGLVASVLATLMSGGSVVCPAGFVPPRFFELWKTFGPTWFTAVPTIHQAIVTEAQTRTEPLPRPGLRLIRSCSSPLAPVLLERLEAVFGCPVIEAYGMTETAHQITSNPLPSGARRPGSVGRAAGPEIAIVNDAGRPVGPGIIGEVVVRGENVMSGYLDSRGASGQALRRGWFHTGDDGFLDADGYLTLTGRRKEMINRGGEKIAPREVEEALLSHPAIAQTVVFALPDPELGEDVAAAVILRPGCRVSDQTLRAHVNARLAPFKVPRRIVFVREIPTGPTGKVQRIALARQLGLRPGDDRRPGSAARGSDARLRTPWERAVAHAYAETLGVSDVTADDDFYRLGGTSLKAVRLVLRLNRDLATDISVRAVFDNPTVGKLAAVVAEAARAAPSTKAGRGPRAAKETAR